MILFVADNLSNSKIETVILLARWTLYLEGVPFNNMEGGLETGGNIYGLPISEDKNFIHNTLAKINLI